MKGLDVSPLEINNEYTGKCILEVKMFYDFAKVYEKQNRSIGIAHWHIEFCTKYRFKMFAKFKYKNLVNACIRRACSTHNIEIVVLSVMPEHVHLVVRASVNLSANKLLQFIKGASSYYFFRNHPKARFRYPKGHLWSKGKFIASVGLTDLDLAVSYVLHQEEHHASSLINTSSGSQTL